MNKISTKKKLYRSNLVEAEIDVIQNKVLVEERRDQLLDAAQDLFICLLYTSDAADES